MCNSCVDTLASWWRHVGTFFHRVITLSWRVATAAEITFMVTCVCDFNPLECQANYSATQYQLHIIECGPHWIIWSWYTGHWQVGCYIRYSDEGTGLSRSPPWPLLAVPNIMVSHPSADSVPIIVLLYNGLLLCGFNEPVKGLTACCNSASKVTGNGQNYLNETFSIDGQWPCEIMPLN